MVWKNSARKKRSHGVYYLTISILIIRIVSPVCGTVACTCIKSTGGAHYRAWAVYLVLDTMYCFCVDFLVSVSFFCSLFSPGWSASAGSPSPSFREKSSFLLSVTSYGRSVFHATQHVFKWFRSKRKVNLEAHKHAHDASRTLVCLHVCTAVYTVYQVWH